MYTIEWSADYLVVGLRFAGSPIIPKAIYFNLNIKLYNTKNVKNLVRKQ